MSFWKRLFNRKKEDQENSLPGKKKETKIENESSFYGATPGEIPVTEPPKQGADEHVQEERLTNQLNPEKRSIRVFVSSTFRDMIEDRNELMTHCWPALRKLCADKPVELTEVD